MGDALSSSAEECQNLKPDTKLLTVRSAAGHEIISDDGRIILAKQMETFESVTVSHTHNPTCFAVVHALSELLLLTIVHKGQPAAGS